MFTGRSAEFATELAQVPTENGSLSETDIEKVAKIIKDLNTICPRLANKNVELARKLVNSLDVLDSMFEEKTDKTKFAVFFQQLIIQIKTFSSCFAVHESELSSLCNDVISRLSTF